MSTRAGFLFAAALPALFAPPVKAQDDAVLRGAKAVWDLEKAHRESTPTRERICLNGLWRWQPATPIAASVPERDWGYFKVPGFWPGLSNYIQEDTQTLFAHPSWKTADYRQVHSAWHQREFTVPADWAGRRIVLAAEYVNSLALVFVDGTKAGEIRFPAGEVDLTAACRPGGKHTLSLLLVALPLKGVLLSYSDPNAAREVEGTVERRGLCGDVFLVSTPAGPRISDVDVDCSVRNDKITVGALVANLSPDSKYRLSVSIPTSAASTVDAGVDFSAADVRDGRVEIQVPRKELPDKLWDLHTPQNMFTAKARLTDAGGKLLDAFDPVRFGVREFWIDGKDFYLNGTRIFLSAVPLDNAQLGARTASYAGALETMKRLKSFGINFVYTHNYGCQPGSHVGFAEILRAADDIGMLVGFSQPHFGHYDWKADDADHTNGYARHAEFYVHAARNHPSVVAYSMSHNATGYDEDMNPDLIDGRHDPRGDGWSRNNAQLALRAEAIVRRLDPGRIVYHHSSGNLGSMHTANFYLNFAPIQEVSDWFEHWAAEGVKPMFPVEYGVPFSWDWTMYRGWYQGQRNFGSAKVPWEFCLAEWNAQFVGDRAYRISDRERANLRYEARQFAAGNLWHRWDYPHQVGARDFDERAEIFARYITDNWRAFRTWGLSANSPWEYQIFWKLREGADRRRRDFKVDWDDLQQPGFSADFTERRDGQMTTDFDADDWLSTAAAEALVRNNGPLLGYIAGKSGAFTGKDHNIRPGETVEKQLVVINNSRQTVSCDCAWSFDATGAKGTKTVTVPTGEQHRVPLRFELPSDAAPRAYSIEAQFHFSTGDTQSDRFTIDVLPPPVVPRVTSRIALYDPKGATGKLLDGLGIAYQTVDAQQDLAGFDVMVIGKDALTPGGPGPDVTRVRDGLKVIVFEQNAQVLEQRFGFRVAEYGLREVFARVPDHPLLEGLSAMHLRDWRGVATILPPRLEYTLRPRYGPTVKWCGIDVPRVWRCGCRGNVASVLIDKPARGDFLSIVDGGWALQYSPLLEYREGRGLVVFCQLDVTGRSESDPASDALVRNLVGYVSKWKPRSNRRAIYVGEAAGRKHLIAAGFTVADYSSDALTPDRVLVVGPGGGRQLAPDAAMVAAWIKRGGHLLAIGLAEDEARTFLPWPLTTTKAEHIAAYFDAPGRESLLAGVGPSDLHNRDPRTLYLVDGGAARLGDGVLAQSPEGNVVFCQIVPWQFDLSKTMNLKRTFRRASYALTRLASNLGAESATPVLARFATPAGEGEQRWREGLYLDEPVEWDDPYRFFRW